MSNEYETTAHFCRIPCATISPHGLAFLDAKPMFSPLADVWEIEYHGIAFTLMKDAFDDEADLVYQGRQNTELAHHVAKILTDTPL